MSLPLPALDDRRWADLVDEGRTLIPVHAPRWTDHNVHDPGITLMELFAWIAETDVYRLDRVTDEHRRKFLALAGVVPEPPTGAVAAISFEVDGEDAVVLPAGLEVEGDDLLGVAVRYRTRRGITAVPGRLAAVQSRSGGELGDLTARRRRGELLPVFGPDPGIGAALYLGLRLPAGVPRETVSFYFNVAGEDRDERRRLEEEERRRRRTCRPAPALVHCPAGEETGEPAGDPADAGDPIVLRHHSARLVWEAHVGARRFQPVDVVRDDTRAFTLSGAVELRLPADAEPGRFGKVDEELFYLRCRLASGAFDAAPEVAAVLLNGVDAVQEQRIEREVLDKGSGRPHQSADLRRPLVSRGPVEVFTHEDGAERSWTERPDFDASGRSDAHFTVDRQTGAVTFGDGERGRTVPAGVLIEATYRSTRGPDGRLDAGGIARLATTPWNEGLLDDLAGVKDRIVEIHQPLAAAGGSRGETLDEAARRALELVDNPHRAVTLADYETQARGTPGTRIARAEARADLHPAFPCFRASGVVTVIVVPGLPVRRPVPSLGLRRAVAAWLEARRPLGTRVEVVGPKWVEVAVRATVRACPGVARGELAARLGEAVDRFFHPLSGGPDGAGWPFGREVFRSEVLQVLDETAGSDHVLALELVDAGGKASCGNLCLPATALVAAGTHEIEVV